MAIPRNRKQYPLIVLLFTLLLALACGGIGLAYEQDLAAEYAVWAPDANTQAAVVQKIPDSSSASVVIEPMVFAYGWNEDFIIVKQHPNLGGFDEVDVSITHWFILEVANERIYGPLAEEAYLRARKTLGVPDDLDFTRSIEP